MTLRPSQPTHPPSGRASAARDGYDVGGLAHIVARPPRVGLVAGGLGAYWPQFPDSLPQLRRSSARVSQRMTELNCEVIDVGFISDAEEGARPAEHLRVDGWTDAGSGSGVGHHWALGTGHRIAELRATAELLELDLVEVRA